jgi:hypothetical protein
MTTSSDVPRQGDVYCVERLRSTAGDIRPKEGHQLVVLFLGACEVGLEPDVPAFLERIGFRRSHVFETTFAIRQHEGIEYETCVFTADSPAEAALSALRMARGPEMRDCQLQGLAVRLRRLGPVDSDGNPHDGRGKVFASWTAESGRTLEEFESECLSTIKKSAT